MHIQSHKLGILVSFSDVLWQALGVKVFWAVWAFFSFSAVDSSDVSLQTTWSEVFETRGAIYFDAVMNLADVPGETPRLTESFPALRTLVGHLRTSCSTWVVNSFLIIASLHLLSSPLNGQLPVFVNLRSAI